jgi:hypothetical protein
MLYGNYRRGGLLPVVLCGVCCVAGVDELPLVIPDDELELDLLVLSFVVDVVDGVVDIDPLLVELPEVRVPLVLVELCVPTDVPLVDELPEFVVWALAAYVESAMSKALAATTFFIT